MEDGFCSLLHCWRLARPTPTNSSALPHQFLCRKTVAQPGRKGAERTDSTEANEANEEEGENSKLIIHRFSQDRSSFALLASVGF
jgi:hypothetical protein